MSTEKHKARIVAQIDALCAIARKRMDEADPIMVGLHPSEVDWMTRDELAYLHNLKLSLPSHGEERAAAIERLKQKRKRKK